MTNLYLIVNRQKVIDNGSGWFKFRNEISVWIRDNLMLTPLLLKETDNDYLVIFESLEDATLFRLRWGFG